MATLENSYKNACISSIFELECIFGKGVVKLILLNMANLGTRKTLRKGDLRKISELGMRI